MKQDLRTTVKATDFGALRSEMLSTLKDGDLSEAMRDCAELAHKSFAANFANTEGPHSGAWPERKEPFAGMVDENGQPWEHPLEIISGAMFQAVTSEFGDGNITDIERRGAGLGVDPEVIPYAASQNYGDEDRGLPQREFVDVDDATEEQMAEAVADEMERLLQ